MPNEGLEHVRALRAANVLDDTSRTQRLNLKKGVIAVCCSDGDQLADKFKHQSTLCQAGLPYPRVHALALNGGALLLPPHSPLNSAIQHHDVLVKQIEDAIRFKAISTIKLYSHWPCLAAASQGLSVLDCLELILQARTIVLRQRFAQGNGNRVEVACMFHVDYGEADTNGDMKKRTYCVSSEMWARWKRAANRSLPTIAGHLAG